MAITPEAESLAATQVCAALLVALKRTGTLAAPEIDRLLEAAAAPLARASDSRSTGAVEIIQAMRVQARSD